ncbi:Crp/Fnr family transcriptional regulator [Hyphomicrobium sp. CS1GBMeth3]|uniref:Crp/Fnr family transcriptional regulator n=1 Tax=Hyphomicrobium sp. CS1GBMeth3 TaxID=1892845 RepID=UPI000930278F|nr:Crp/Fnr family transcriptional regulator [Hyphomicrobium sp. CS1GBMeth3]
MSTVLDLLSAPLEPYAVRIATRKRQRLSLAAEPEEMLYLIRKGLHLTSAPMPHDRHQVLSILYPGDIVRASALPPIEGAAVISASDKGEVWRVRWSAIEALLGRDANVARVISDRLTDQAARSALHKSILAGLSGDERVVALMLEIAARTGRETATGVTFEMPLSRNDIAEYMALNADTVSRIVSRLRASGVLTPAGRNLLICPSFADLARACPLAPAITRLHNAGHLLPA